MITKVLPRLFMKHSVDCWQPCLFTCIVFSNQRLALLTWLPWPWIICSARLTSSRSGVSGTEAPSGERENNDVGVLLSRQSRKIHRSIASRFSLFVLSTRSRVRFVYWQWRSYKVAEKLKHKIFCIQWTEPSSSLRLALSLFAANLYMGWSDVANTIAILWSNTVVLYVVNWWRFVALFE